MPTQDRNKGIKKPASKLSKPSKPPEISSTRTTNKIFGIVKNSASTKASPAKDKRVTFTECQHLTDNKKKLISKNTSVAKHPSKKILKERIEKKSEEDLIDEIESLEEDQESVSSENDYENLSEESENEVSDDSENLVNDIEIDESDDSELSEENDDTLQDSAADIADENEEPAAKRVKKENPNQARIKKAFERKRKADRKLDPEYILGLKECWEFARRIDISPEERRKYMNELFELIDGIIPELLFKHDTSRIIQTVLKYGTKEQISKIASELEGRWLEASKSKYAKDKIVSELEGNVARLLMHSEARNIVLEAYELSNGKQRLSLIQEFYGPEFTLFKACRSINLYELIGKHVPEILHTREGAKVAMFCLLYASAKERKGILQSMKDYVDKICCEEYGYLVLLRAFDVVDDTVSVTKYIIDDPIVRARELRKVITPALIEYAKNNTAHMLSSPYTTQILFETMLCGESSAEEKTPVLENIASIISEKRIDSEDNIMLTYVNRFLKVLVQGGHRRYPKRNIAEKDNPSDYIGSIDGKPIIGDNKGDASFVVLALLENHETKEEVGSILVKGMDSIRNAALEDDRSGASLILKALSELSFHKQKGDTKKVETKKRSSVVSRGKKGGKRRKHNADA
ncbi:4548_t:CDS:2 [Acaulospora colombiana]|uniref:4548_t:CDS:1 n=1 Tax=Acaulospora colombiana TaxID=27376 RepID=A0ACA9LZX6_9GLOM|nr:4548_t:CDS:2 [Acaulospora colombiana]